MRCIVLLKASKDSEKGVMPSAELLAAMGKYNEELVKAGIMQGAGACGRAPTGSECDFQAPSARSSTVLSRRCRSKSQFYAALSEGGEIFMAIQETFFALRFAQLRDRFGTSWMLLHERPRP
jgi:uncharacterized glyoxalase superfamily protein PhnB